MSPEPTPPTPEIPALTPEEEAVVAPPVEEPKPVPAGPPVLIGAKFELDVADWIDARAKETGTSKTAVLKEAVETLKRGTESTTKEPVEDTPEVPIFPFREGDFTILGPGIFANTEWPEEGTVISWNGENFTAQLTPLGVPQDVVEEPVEDDTFPEEKPGPRRFLDRPRSSSRATKGLSPADVALLAAAKAAALEKEAPGE